MHGYGAYLPILFAKCSKYAMREINQSLHNTKASIEQ